MLILLNFFRQSDTRWEYEVFEKLDNILKIKLLDITAAFKIFIDMLDYKSFVA